MQTVLAIGGHIDAGWPRYIVMQSKPGRDSRKLVPRATVGVTRPAPVVCRHSYGQFVSVCRALTCRHVSVSALSDRLEHSYELPSDEICTSGGGGPNEVTMRHPSHRPCSERNDAHVTHSLTRSAASCLLTSIVRIAGIAISEDEFQLCPSFVPRRRPAVGSAVEFTVVARRMDSKQGSYGDRWRAWAGGRGDAINPQPMRFDSFGLECVVHVGPVPRYRKSNFL
jgi:hypothetical protein